MFKISTKRVLILISSFAIVIFFTYKTKTNIKHNQERIKFAEEAEKILMKDMPAVFLFFQEREIMVNPRVKNIYFISFGMKYYVLEAEMTE